MTISGQELCIGTHVMGSPVLLDPEERRRHLYIVGQTGTGKSTLLLNLIRQDLAAGEGVALLDPHGDLALAALDQVPRRRSNDLIYIDPADLAHPIGFNPLSRVPQDLKPVVADGVVAAFRHVWPDSWGPRLDYILTNTIRALLDVPGATLLMLPRLLIDPAFRARCLERHVTDPVVRDSFALILSEARKYALTLTIGHQYLDQLPEPLRLAVFGNVGSMIACRGGAADAAILASQLGLGGADAVLDLPNFAAWARLLRNGTPSSPLRLDLHAAPLRRRPSLPHRLLKTSRQRFAKPRAAVEARIARFLAG